MIRMEEPQPMLTAGAERIVEAADRRQAAAVGAISTACMLARGYRSFGDTRMHAYVACMELSIRRCVPRQKAMQWRGGGGGARV